MTTRTIPAGLVSKGFQKITTNSTATLLNTTCRAGSAFLISVETQDARLTADGSTTPAASTGVLLKAGLAPYFLEGMNGANLKFARAAAGCVIQVQAFGRPGN